MDSLSVLHYFTGKVNEMKNVHFLRTLLDMIFYNFNLMFSIVQWGFAAFTQVTCLKINIKNDFASSSQLY